ncbi:MAG: ATP-binding protein [Limisphaerales bacterium]
MNASLRLTSFAVAVAVLTILVGWSVRTTWHELHQLRWSFAAVENDVFHLSDYVEVSVRGLEETMFGFDPRKDPAGRARFLKTGQELKQWISAHQASVTTPEERELMDQIEAALGAYLSRSLKLMDEKLQAAATPTPPPAFELAKSNAAQLLELCGKLTAAERVALGQFMKDSHQSLAWLQRLLIASLFLLLGLGGVVGLSVYREMFAPLRSQLRQSRALAARHEKLASLGTLAAGVAHEIRNPLTAINVRLHSLKKNLVPNSSEQEDALVIGHEIQRLERIVQEFLQFARPADPKLFTVSADSLLAKVTSLFGPQLEKTSIRLNLESVPDIWVRVDPHQIEQVLINLIQNAAESMERAGTITLRIRAGTARLQGRARPAVILEVSDTGKGIPPEVQKRIFDPFFTTKEEGTGLGLAIAARIVEKHGGVLECRSEVNHGTTFAILLPHPKSEECDEPPG